VIQTLNKSLDLSTYKVGGTLADVGRMLYQWHKCLSACSLELNKLTVYHVSQSANRSERECKMWTCTHNAASLVCVAYNYKLAPLLITQV